jgi:hypothetical protein
MTEGLRIDRRFTVAGQDPYEGVAWSRRDSRRSANPDGSVVFEMTDAEIPAHWSQVASDIMVSKYFRKAGVPQFDDDREAVVDDNGNPVLGPERSSKQVFDRLAGTWSHWGEKEGYFASADDAQAFEDELKYMLANQMAAPNSPQWFNTGLNWAYGLTGPAQGFWYVDDETGELVPSPDSYSRPAPHACFINGVSDDLVNPGGIMDLWVREARIFKFGSGAGSNFSAIRSENECSPEAASRRRDVVPQDRRPGRRCHQVGRHHPPGRQDGDPRRRPSRHRDLHRLEEGRRGEGQSAHPARRIPRRLQRRGLRHRVRPELEQLGSGHQRLHPGGRG